MTDIVGRLRKQATAAQTLTGNMSSQTIEWLAADEIERLRAERDAFFDEGPNIRRIALEEAADICFALRFKNPTDGEAACNECGEAIRALSAVEKGD